MMLLAIGLSCGLLLYVYAGYPLLLQLLVWIRGARPVRRGPALPRVCLVISAFNEVASIRQKLLNSVALDYPLDLLRIVVVSDASDDGTDDIVREFAAQGVELWRQPARRGKTAGLNFIVSQIDQEIVVFSDANAMYDRAALRMLVRNFADPTVGCVTGEARYLTGDDSTAAAGERAYWNYEISIKRLETAVGSMVGGDGAIYAIRRELWQPLPENAINDFLNPLQIVAAGWRAVYEPDAICYEETAGGIRREWNRRVRIVSRSWRAVFQAPGVLNPFRVGLFAFCLLSHKVLRWLTGVFLMVALTAFAMILLRASASSKVVLGVSAAVVVALIVTWSGARTVVTFIAYYVAISIASLLGVARGLGGRVSGIWTTPRSGAVSAPDSPGVRIRLGPALLIVAGFATALSIAALISPAALTGRKLVFWGALATLAYIYAGYPLLLALVRPLLVEPVHKSPLEPRVCLFVAANNEASVIGAKLRNCLELDYPASRLSVVVASDGSSDGTNIIVRSFADRGVQLIEFTDRRGKMSVINDGVSAVDADIIVFSDANTFLERGAVRALVANFADESVGAVSGDVVLIGDRAALAASEDLYYRYERSIQRAESEIGSMLGVDGALYAIRRDLFVAPASDTILDDMAIPMAIIRAGRRVVFEPTAVAHEYGSETATEEFSRKTRVTAGAVQFLLRRDCALPAGNAQALVSLISHKALRWLSPIFATLALAASVTLRDDSTMFFAAALGQIMFLAVGLIGCMPAFRRWNVVGVAHYFWLMQAAAAVGFVRGLIGRQPAAWRRFTRTPVASGGQL